MASKVPEISSKSAEIDATPRDGEEENGALPHHSAALGQYLCGHSNVKDTVTALTTPAAPGELGASDRPSNLKIRVFGIIEDALVELSETYTIPLIKLLQELDTVVAVDEYGRPLWQGLMDFGHGWSDSWKQRQWEEELPTRDPQTGAIRRAEHIHRAFVEATGALTPITATGIGPIAPGLGPSGTAEKGVLPLSWGYECLSEALDREQDVVRDFEIPAAAVWIRLAGRRIVDGARSKEASWALEVPGRLWPPGPMTPERWQFWCKRPDEIAKRFGGSGDGEGGSNSYIDRDHTARAALDALSSARQLSLTE